MTYGPDATLCDLSNIKSTHLTQLFPGLIGHKSLF